MKFRPDEERITRAIDRARDTWGPLYGVSVPRELVRAMIVRESRVQTRPVLVDTLATRHERDRAGRVYATSYGLMQVLDTTAKELGLKGDPKALYIPEVGISYGVKYLAKQLRRYGNIVKAVAAYNAGSARQDAKGRFVNSRGLPIVQDYVDFVFSWFRRFMDQAKAAAGTATDQAKAAAGAATEAAVRLGPGGPALLVALLVLALPPLLALLRRRA